MFHLQAVFESAKKIVGTRQFGAFQLRYETSIGKSAQAYQRMRDAQPIVAAAMGELQGLGNELDLPYSTAAQFHVIAAFLFDLMIDFLFGQPNTGKRRRD
jgi:hypothetical protein